MDQIIEGKAFIDDTFQDCCIAITDGKIVDIKKIIKGSNRKKFSKRLILPAGIDIHVHFRDPGLTHKEDFYTGSLSAAFGGISCICDMPNTKPFTATTDTLKEKNTLAQKKSVIDYGLYLGITKNNLSELQNIHALSCGFKLFLGKTTESTEIPAESLATVFKNVSESNKILAVHAEDANCLDQYRKKENTLHDHASCRPDICELRSIEKLLSLHKETNIRLHICHISSAVAMKLLYSRDSSISVGVTPHHMFLDIENEYNPPSYFKVNPPIRQTHDKEFLMNSLKIGKIDVVESDHAPHTCDEKENEFQSAPSGLPGVETMFPMLLAKARQDKIALTSVIRNCAHRPAEIMGMPKGQIAVGRDADFCIIDYNNIQSINGENLHSKCKWSPFEGLKAIFPSDLYIRGSAVISDYVFVGEKGFGNNFVSLGA
jgi:dihydroorotase